MTKTIKEIEAELDYYFKDLPEERKNINLLSEGDKIKLEQELFRSWICGGVLDDDFTAKVQYYLTVYLLHLRYSCSELAEMFTENGFTMGKTKVSTEVLKGRQIFHSLANLMLVIFEERRKNPDKYEELFSFNKQNEITICVKEENCNTIEEPKEKEVKQNE